ncbi:MAG: hypothetical protein LJF04_14200 [Gemmatimonadetes bacterium]|nr:hypothetical protein [Gemmatimonadota bacterium]
MGAEREAPQGSDASKAAGVSRLGRLLDLAGLLLFLVGAAVFVRAWIGLEGVRHYQAAPDDLPWAATRLASSYVHVQHVGGGIMLAGIAVFVAAWWMAGRGTAA